LKPPTSCVLHLLQATRMRFQHVSTKPLRFFFNGCPKDFQIIHLGCHLCFGSQGLRGVIPHQNESRIEKCSNIYHSNIFFWAPSNDAVCAAFFGTLFGGPLGPPCVERNCRAQAHSGATKRYVVRTDNPMEAPSVRTSLFSEIWDPLNPNLFGAWNCQRWSKQSENHWFNIHMHPYAIHGNIYHQPIRKSGRLQWLGPQSFKTVENVEDHPLRFFM
jgi:hypothetical protein